MALQHAQSGDPVDVRPFGAKLADAQTTALFKSDDLEVMRLVLLTGKLIPPHKVAGEITILCLEGSIEVSVDGGTQILEANQLMYLSGGVMHSLIALEDASALLTIVLRK